MTMEESNVFRSSVIKYSLILGLVGILINVLVYVISETLLTQWWFGLLSILIWFGLYLYAGFSFRKEAGGYLEFKKAFLFILLIAILSTVINVAYSVLQFTVIDPELGGRLQSQIIENTQNMMEGFGAPQDQIDQQIEKLEEQDMFSAGKLIQQGALYGVIGGVILGLIVGAIIKKKKKEELV